MKPKESKMPLGTILNEAGLISRYQLEVALGEQNCYPDLKIGEILALHGWLKQETADFFAEHWPQINPSYVENPLGHYLLSAGLLSEEQLHHILSEQIKTGMRFGALAVLQGWIKQPTIDFFLKHLNPEELKSSIFKRYHPSLNDGGDQNTRYPQSSRTAPVDDQEEINWVG